MGSAIEKQQWQFAKSVYAAGTKEQFGIAYAIDRVKVRTVKGKWSYQVEKVTNVWRMTAMSRW
ncbi:hypothetical protein [Paenibacillus sp. MMS18-CY102]|uniref:hypothetical protein n=1 Tax=Paenibacillus sp. MMS18-CY102 TaxID=2682849 RepID=UPI00136533AD|nr:hypothetical protein [Paenibacillus sp. MMS18-CY102]MWC29758.1 hypothetical protein [Paenibacillus sp. MMS18-CY102]